jgi:hypothetical protein
VSGITIRHFFKIAGRLDSLCSLKFSLRGRGEPVVNIFESAPWLRTVRVNNLVSPGMLRLPWMQLTTYEDRTTFGDGVFKAFRLNSNLQHIKFRPNYDEQLGLRTVPYYGYARKFYGPKWVSICHTRTAQYFLKAWTVTVRGLLRP